MPDATSSAGRGAPSPSGASGERPAPAGRRLLLVVGPAAGGIGAHASSLARGLGAHGWHVVVATAGSTAARFDLGGHVEVVWPTGGPVRRLRALLRLRALVRRADLVHAHGHQAGLVVLAAVAIAGRRRPRVVISWHNAVLGSGPGRTARTVLERAQARRADLLTGASQDLVDRARELGAAVAELADVAAPGGAVWAPGRAVARAELAAELGLDPDAPWLLTVSRIAPQKNLGVLVDAAHRLASGAASAQPHPPVWVIVGDGRGDLLAGLRDAAHGADVRFVGARADVPRWLAAADVFVLPSAWEARALVVQEALAAGVAVVATQVGGLPELVGAGGLLVPPGDADALAAAVGRLLADGALRAELGRAGRARAAELPDESAVLAQWDERYRREARRSSREP